MKPKQETDVAITQVPTVDDSTGSVTYGTKKRGLGLG